MSSRIAMLTLPEAEQRAAALGRDVAWGRSNVARVLLHQPAVAEVIAGTQALLLHPTGHLDERLGDLIVLRIGWITGAELDWRRPDGSARDPVLMEADRLAVRDWRTYRGFGPADRAVLAATDDVLASGRISDASWDAWNATDPTIESSIEMAVAIGVWRMASEQVLSLGIPRDDSADTRSPAGRRPSGGRTVTFDGSVSAIGRLDPLDAASADLHCREQGMSPRLARSDVWSRLLRHPALAQVLSTQLYRLLNQGALPARLRELVIMRIGWVTGSVYEWTRHWPLSLKAGLGAPEIIALRDWPNGSFDAAERAVLAATDDTLRLGCISDAVWDACAAVLPAGHLVELTAVIGNWNMISHLLRSLAIPLEEGALHWPPDGKAPFGRSADAATD